MMARRLDFGRRTYVMGILNATPDSFSGDGLINRFDLVQAALEHASRFLAAGADILDIGGESTRPGAQVISVEEEMDRVVPVVRAVHTAFPDVIISVDTYTSKVAQAALEQGADWINDIWGLHADIEMAAVAAKWAVPLILMHNRSKPAQAQSQSGLGGRYVNVEYRDLLADVKAELLESVDLATRSGVKPENIILDPGIGFGKTVEQNLELIERLNEVRAMGFPVLLGPSRKSFIGYTLNVPPTDRVEGTLAACVLGIVRGADILRVHDVESVVRAARMTDAILHHHPIT